MRSGVSGRTRPDQNIRPDAAGMTGRFVGISVTHPNKSEDHRGSTPMARTIKHVRTGGWRGFSNASLFSKLTFDARPCARNAQTLGHERIQVRGRFAKYRRAQKKKLREFFRLSAPPDGNE